MSTETKIQTSETWIDSYFNFAKNLADTASNIGRWALMLGAIKYVRLHSPSIELLATEIALNSIFTFYISMLFVAKFDLGLIKPRQPIGWRLLIGGLIHVVLSGGGVWIINHLTNVAVDTIAQRPM
jgi:hypothetical protein